MGVFRALIQHLYETAPARLRTLPQGLLRREADEMLAQGELYPLEQVQKTVDIVTGIPAARLEEALYRALAECRVDDVCFLHDRLGPVFRFHPGRVAAAYETLARRGNVGGLEVVAGRTKIPPRLSRETALAAYDVLVATGRLGAADYVRQLSGVPITYSPDAVQLACRLLLVAGRPHVIRELEQRTGVPAVLEPAELTRASARAVDGLELRVAAAIAALGYTPALGIEDHASLLRRVIEAGRLTEIPALFRLVPGTDATTIPDTILEALLETGDPEALAFLFGRSELEAFQRAHASLGYALALALRARDIVRAIHERTGAPLRPEDAATLLEDALVAGDVPWVLFACGHLSSWPAFETGLVDVFLYELELAGDPHRAEVARALGQDLDHSRGGFVHAVKHGRWDDAARALRETPAIARELWWATLVVEAGLASPAYQ
jgi:hypothetical protein